MGQCAARSNIASTSVECGQVPVQPGQTSPRATETMRAMHDSEGCTVLSAKLPNLGPHAKNSRIAAYR